jgi:hypothetical protein
VLKKIDPVVLTLCATAVIVACVLGAALSPDESVRTVLVALASALVGWVGMSKPQDAEAIRGLAEALTTALRNSERPKDH